MNSRDALHVVTAMERALRPSFRSPPETERQVQDAASVILSAIGLAFHRDKEVAAVGPRAFRPDFTVPDLVLAIEVKLAKPGHEASAIQEELSADIAAYRTRWSHFLAIIYDVGVISDPHGFYTANMTHFGVSALIIKH